MTRAVERVAVVSGVFPPSNSGEAQHALLLARALAGCGLDVHVLTRRGVVSEPSVHVRPLMRGWTWRELPTLARFLRATAPDVVLLLYIGWTYENHPMVTYAPTIARLVVPRARFVTQFENAIGAEPYRYGFLGHNGWRAAAVLAGVRGVDYHFGTLLRDSDATVVLSEHHRRALAAHAPMAAARSALIPPPPLLTIVPEADEVRRAERTRLGLDPDDFVVVHLGYLYPGKGIETLLRAFALLATERERAKLLLVGGPLEGHEAYPATVRRLATELGIQKRVRWAGAYAWDGSRGSTLLRAADVFVMPIEIGVQLNNSSVGAAAAHGLPLVATRGELVERAFRDGENVLLCAPRDPDAMAAAIRAVMDDEPLRRRLRRGACELADEWFSWRRAVDRTLASFSA